MLDFITWNANPILFHLGPLHVRWYGLMFAIGFWIGTNIVAKMFKHEGQPESWTGILLIYTVVATVLGARLGHVFFYEWDYYSQHTGEILAFWKGGLASHGGTIGIIIAILLFSWQTTKKSPLWTLDRLCVPVALVGGLIRLGNLFNHEIFGHPTSLPWGFRFIDNVGPWMYGYQDPVYTLPSHPTQIYEALCYFILFGILMWMYWKKNAEERPGLLLGVFFTVCFGFRILIEFVKNPQVEFEQNMLFNMGQLLSVPFVIAGVILIVRAMRRPRLHLKFPNAFAPEPKKK